MSRNTINASAHPNEDFVAGIAHGTAPSPSFRDGPGVQRVLEAVERSAAASSRWTRVNTLKWHTTRVRNILGVRGTPQEVSAKELIT